MEAMWAAVVVGDGKLPGVDVLVGVEMRTWVLEPVNDVIVESILVVWDAVGLMVGRVADLLASYDYQFLVGNEPVHYWCGAQRAEPSMVHDAVASNVDIMEVLHNIDWRAYLHGVNLGKSTDPNEVPSPECGGGVGVDEGPMWGIPVSPATGKAVRDGSVWILV